MERANHHTAPFWVNAHPCPSDLCPSMCVSTSFSCALWGFFCSCVCVCEEQLSGVASASIGSNVIYGNKCIRSLLSIHLSFSKKEQRIQRVLQQLLYLSKLCCDKWIQASIGEKTSFNLISWLSKVMFHYTVWSWLIMLSSEAQQVTRIVTSGSQRSLNSMRKVSCVLEDFAKTSSERQLFTSWGSTKSPSINV